MPLEPTFLDFLGFHALPFALGFAPALAAFLIASLVP